MTFQESLSYLYSKLPMFQRTGHKAIKKNLHNTIRLLDLLGNPHENLKFIHIAGTNGKGTSAVMITSILRSAGFNVGLYSSPHLKEFTERIQVNDHVIPEDKVVEFVQNMECPINQANPSFFEVTVAMAFWHFKESKVDYVVLETGLGGRFDSTNVVIPVVSLITNIGYDHMDILGYSLEEIAREKAGIIKKNIPVVIGTSQPDIYPVFEKEAKKNNSIIERATRYDIKLKTKNWNASTVDVYEKGTLLYPDLKISNGAEYVLRNLAGVLTTVKLAVDNISHKAIYKGLSALKIRGRMQVLQEKPLIVADVSHNQPGISLLLKQILNHNKGDVHVILGFVRDKDLQGIFKLFPRNLSYYFTESQTPRSLKALDLKNKAKDFQLIGNPYANVNLALEAAKTKAMESDLILVTGSNFIVGEIINL